MFIVPQYTYNFVAISIKCLKASCVLHKKQISSICFLKKLLFKIPTL